jgi:cytochrome c
MKYCLLLLLLSVMFLSACGEQPDVSVPPEANQAAPVRQEAADAVPAVQLSGAELFAVACQACHSIAPEAPHRVGPNLYGIVGQAAASREGFSYSPALQQSGLTWNKADLMAWIVAPESLVPGTWMLYHNVLTGDEVPRLIEYLEQVNTSNQP